MANKTTVFYTISNDVLLCSIIFKVIAMTVGVLGNVSVVVYSIFLSKEKTPTSYLVGNLALADLLVCLTFHPIWIIEFVQTMLNIHSDQDFFCKLARSTVFALAFASVATLLSITVDRYLYIVKPMRYPLIVTSRRVFLAVLGIWLTACCFFIVIYVHVKSAGNGFRSFCDLLKSIFYFITCSIGYIPLILIFFLNFKILSIARKQRKRILPAMMINSVNNSNEGSGNRMSFVFGFLRALKAAKTFAIVFAVFRMRGADF